MRRNKLTWVIPKEVLVKACNDVMKASPGSCCDKWGEAEASLCRTLCGEKYMYIETDWIRHAAITLRKAGLLESINGGPKRRKLSPPNAKYLEYLSSDHWRKTRDRILDMWGGKCCLCSNRASDVHHNSYDRVGCETITDLVPLCRRCHKRFHGAMPDGNNAFTPNNYIPGGLFNED